MGANVTKQITCLQFLATATSGATPIFLGGVKRLMIRTLNNDVYVDFDQPVAPTTSFRLSASNTADTTVELDQGLISNIYIQAVGANSQVYIVSIVG